MGTSSVRWSVFKNFHLILKVMHFNQLNNVNLNKISQRKIVYFYFLKEKRTIVFLTGFFILLHFSFRDYQDWISLESIEKY